MKWVICINNEGYAASLELRKLYASLEDEKAQASGFLRIIDESGEGYLYPQGMFQAIHVDPSLQEQLLAAC